jgi:hypothetical protein
MRAGVWSRYVDTRNNFIYEHIKVRVVNVKFFRSTDCDSDIFKNCINNKIYESMGRSFWGILKFWYRKGIGNTLTFIKIKVYFLRVYLLGIRKNSRMFASDSSLILNKSSQL